MQIVKAEIIKIRKPHRKTKYQIVWTVKYGFLFFAICRRHYAAILFNTYEQAYRYIRRTHPDVKHISAGK